MPLPLVLLGTYFTFGVGFALFFVTLGVGRIDPTARGATVGFRLLLLPGTTLLWPLLAMRWVRGAEPPLEATAHKSLSVHGQRGQR